MAHCFLILLALAAAVHFVLATEFGTVSKDNERQAFLAPRAANAAKMGLGPEVIKCIDRELAKLQKHPDLEALTVIEKNAKYEDFFNAVLPGCVGFTSWRSASVFKKKDHRMGFGLIGSMKERKAEQRKKKKNQDFNDDPQSVGTPTKPYTEYCGACDSGCHWCCIQKGTPGFDYCFLVYCGGNQVCH